MVFTTERLEIAIESWPEWVGFEFTTTKFCSDALTDWAIKLWVQLAVRANFLQLLQFYVLFRVIFRFGYCLRQSPRLSNGSNIEVITWVYWNELRMILRSSYRKLAWVEFEPKTIEFHSDALTNWAIRPWVQLAFRAYFVQLLQFHVLLNVIFHFGYCLRQSSCLFNPLPRNVLEQHSLYIV